MNRAELIDGHAGETASKLERELAEARDQLRVLIGEHDAAREEMKAANEEILSSNEELQSTNEELETAKEELQSTNEELITLNEELQHRNAELNVLTGDLNNLLTGVDIPVLVLDEELRVRRYTPVAGTLLHLIPGDVGRPFTDIASLLTVAEWQALFSEVRSSGGLIEHEVKDAKSGRRYSLRVRPYRTDNDRINGILVTLFDIEALRLSLEQAQESQDVAQRSKQLSDSILNSLTSSVAVIDSSGTIVTINEAWSRFAKENGNPTPKKVGVGANYLQVCQQAAAEGIPGAKAALEGIEGVLKGQHRSFRIEYPCDGPDAPRWFIMTVSPLKATVGGAVIVHSNITDRKLAETAAERSESNIRALLDSSSQSIIAVRADSKIVIVNGNTEKMFGYRQQELLGQSLELLIPEAARARHAKHHKLYFNHMESRPMGIGLELSARRKDGTTFPVEIALGVITMAGDDIAVAFVGDITERRRLELIAKSHADEVSALAASLLTAQEEERRRVSRELHDQICQQLASLAIDIGGLAAEPALADTAQNQLKALQARVVKASDETRHIAYELHPSVLDDLGLVASLRALCNEFSDRHKETAVEFIGLARCRWRSPAKLPPACTA